MKNSFLSLPRTNFKTTPVLRYLLIASFLVLGSQMEMLHAQSKLSIQGILKKASGEAVPDGNYNLTFKLYPNETGGPVLWDEIQQGVEVVSGIYSTVLGNDSILNVAFNQVYYLGVSVNSGTEMTPRVQLTSAPYALSLIGITNQFPSTGQVKADNIKMNGTNGLNITTGGIVARSGAPGANGISNNGIAFSGDTDSGLFSVGADQVSLHVNNQEEVKITPDSVRINGDLSLQNGRSISYNGLDDWRLVETDYFDTDAEGWKIYNTWDAATGTAATVTTFSDAFAGKAITNTSLNQVLKKKFTLPGSAAPGTYTYVKVVFKYYYLDSWDLEAKEKGYAAFSKTENCASLSVGWVDDKAFTGFGHGLGNGAGSAFDQAATFYGGTGGSAYSDQWTKEEMVGTYPSGAANADFWVIFGAALNDSPESFGVGMIEIWVK